MSGSERSSLAGCRRAAGLLLLSAVAAPGPCLSQSVFAIDVADTRTFGYVIGDKIRREATLTVERGYRLDEASLPKAGRLDRWLELAEPAVREESSPGGRRYHLSLTYQVFNAPSAPETITLPQQNLRILGPAEAEAGPPATTLIPALRVSVMPVTRGIDAKELTGSSLAPDRPPLPVPVRAEKVRLTLMLGALVLLCLLAVWRRGFERLTARRRLPFARALRRLRQVPRAAGDADRAGLKIVHEAINRTAGHAVFAHNLDAFLAAHPRFDVLRGDLALLFDASATTFFVDAETPPGTDLRATLLRLCRRGRAAERRRPRENAA